MKWTRSLVLAVAVAGAECEMAQADSPEAFDAVLGRVLLDLPHGTELALAAQIGDNHAIRHEYGPEGVRWRADLFARLYFLTLTTLAGPS